MPGSTSHLVSSRPILAPTNHLNPKPQSSYLVKSRLQTISSTPDSSGTQRYLISGPSPRSSKRCGVLVTDSPVSSTPTPQTRSGSIFSSTEPSVFHVTGIPCETTSQTFTDAFTETITQLSLTPSRMSEYLQVATIRFDKVPDALSDLGPDGCVDHPLGMFWEGFDMTARDINERTMLCSAALYGDVELTSMLVQFGSCDINARDKDGRTALHLACLQEEVETVQVLLQVPGVDLGLKTSDGQTAFGIATRSRGYLVGMLVWSKVFGGENNQVDPRTRPVAMWAEGGGTDGDGGVGDELIFDAAREGNDRRVNALLQAGVDVNGVDDLNRTPLWIAAQKGHLGVVNTLLQAGANPNLPDKDHVSPLHMAAADNHETVVTALLQAGADVNAEDDRADTALHIAAMEGYSDVVKTLLQSPGIDVNKMGVGGYTAFHYAVRSMHRGRDYVAVVELLLANADLDQGLKTHHRQTARELAVEANHKGVLRILQI